MEQVFGPVATTLDRHSLLAAVRNLVKERANVASTISARGAALRTDAGGFYKRIADLVNVRAAPPGPQHGVTQLGRERLARFGARPAK